MRKHRTGIALTVLGSVFTIAGVAMLAGGITANGQTSSYVGNGGAHASVNVGVTGIIGALMTIAGVPMLISGGVKLGRSKKMARAALLYLH